MKKGFRPSRTTHRPASRPSTRHSNPIRIGGSPNQSKKEQPGGVFTPHSTGMNPQSGHVPDSFDQSKKGAGLGNQGGYLNQPYGRQNRRRGRWSIPVIIGVVVVICCLVALCIAGIYYVYSQGLINI